MALDRFENNLFDTVQECYDDLRAVGVLEGDDFVPTALTPVDGKRVAVFHLINFAIPPPLISIFPTYADRAEATLAARSPYTGPQSHSHARATRER